MDYFQVMLNYLDSILKSITNRTYQIKNAIEWQKFIRGYSDLTLSSKRRMKYM